MDDGSVINNIAPLIIPILALSIPIVAIIMGVIAKIRRAELMHETVRQMVTQGREIPPQLLDGSLLEERRPAVANPNLYKNSQLIFGAINVGAGLGLTIMFYAMSPSDWLWAIGCVPLFIGIAILLAWKVQFKSTPR